MGLTRATLQNEHTGTVIPVMFNPEEYSLSQDNNFASQAIPGLSGPVLQFVHGNARTLEMELFFDTSVERRDVRAETQKVVSLLAIDPELHAPPVLRLRWASLDFRCVLTRASQRFVRFLESGYPVRAHVQVSFQEMLDPEQEAREVGRQTADHTKVHQVERGETLSSLAGRFYENPRTWRPIARANDITVPRADLTGRHLLIPPLPWVDPVSGEVHR